MKKEMRNFIEIPQRFSEYKTKFNELNKQYEITPVKIIRSLKNNKDYRDSVFKLAREMRERDGAKFVVPIILASLGMSIGSIGIAAMGTAIGITLWPVLGVFGAYWGIKIDQHNSEKYNENADMDEKYIQDIIGELASNVADFEMQIKKEIDYIYTKIDKENKTREEMTRNLVKNEIERIILSDINSIRDEIDGEREKLSMLSNTVNINIISEIKKLRDKSAIVRRINIIFVCTIIALVFINMLITHITL